MRMLLPSLLVLCAATGFGCRDGSSPVGPEVQDPAFAISDGAHGGNPHFYFLPPLVPQPQYSGVFDPARSPTVQICLLTGGACGSVVAEYTMTTGPDSVTVQLEPLAERYSVDWHTDRFALTEGATYRIRVLLDGGEAGHADVLRSGTGLKDAQTGTAIALTDGSTLPIRFRIEVGLKPLRLVPAQAPDSAPQWIEDPWTYAPEAVDTTNEFITGHKLKNVVVLIFKSGATLIERQLAVDAVDGEVVGGAGSSVSGIEGLYFVRFPHDGTLEPLKRTVSALDSMPQVSWASAYFLDSWAFPLYRKPSDSQGWQQWQVQDTLADNLNWGLEAVNAPLGWGCAAGSAGTAVAVVDHGFHAPQDLTANVNSSLSVPGYGLFTEQHGSVVASIIGARGNNNTGITGATWLADLRLYDVALDVTGTPGLNGSSLSRVGEHR